MLTSHRSVGNLPTPGKNIRKQQSDTFGGSTRTRRNPSIASSGPRPTSEFGWQLALHGASLDPKGTIMEEETPREMQDGSNTSSYALHDGASEPQFPDPPPYSTQTSFSHNHSGHGNANATSSSSSSTTKDLAEKYADKDIGWQLALQGQEIPAHNIPSERSLGRSDSNPYSGVDITSRESPRPTQHHPKGNIDNFQPLNLDEAAKVYSGFSINNSESIGTPSATRAPSYLASNPFHAIIQSAEGSNASKRPLIDVSEEPKGIQLPNLAKDLAMVDHPQRQSEGGGQQEELIACEHCPKQVPVRRISQFPTCLHLVCHDCLLSHIEKQLFDSYFPIVCPLCLLLEHQSHVGATERKPINQGVVTLEIMQIFQASAPSTFNVFQEFQISSQSSQVFCPQCQETMLVDRAQYLQQTIVTCPRQTCNHRWCKSCFKDMSSAAPGTANAKHKCKPHSVVGVRACPECGYQGRRIAGDNLILCRGVGCRLQFCFKCGETISDGSKKERDILQQTQAHYRKCTRISKEEKCILQ